MLVYGCLLGCSSDALTLAAAMSSRSPFLRGDAGDAIRQRIAGDSRSDHVTLLAAYAGWRRAGGGSSRGTRITKEIRKFCESHSLSMVGMQSLAELRRQLAVSMRSLGFLVGKRRRGGRRENEEDEENDEGDDSMALALEGGAEALSVERLRLLRAVLCAGMYPNGE